MVVFMMVFQMVLMLYFCFCFVDDFVTAVTTCFIVVFSFWTINYISLELEMPFGDDPNDLPLEEMQRDFNLSLIGLLRKRFLHPPTFSVKPGASKPQVSR